jgi:hypothetical protein
LGLAVTWLVVTVVNPARYALIGLGVGPPCLEIRKTWDRQDVP